MAGCFDHLNESAADLFIPTIDKAIDPRLDSLRGEPRFRAPMPIDASYRPTEAS